MVKAKEDAETGQRSGLKITNFSCTVQATWKNNEGEVQTSTLNLVIPDCVKNLLETCGENGDLKNTLLYINKDRKDYPIIYYSSCNGKILKVTNYE